MNNHFSRSLAPIDRSGITELVVQRIKELLQQGELKAGSRLPRNTNSPKCSALVARLYALSLPKSFHLQGFEGNLKDLTSFKRESGFAANPL